MVCSFLPIRPHVYVHYVFLERPYLTFLNLHFPSNQNDTEMNSHISRPTNTRYMRVDRKREELYPAGESEKEQIALLPCLSIIPSASEKGQCVKVTVMSDIPAVLAVYIAETPERCI
jgi:hypothetical protein